MNKKALLLALLLTLGIFWLSTAIPISIAQEEDVYIGVKKNDWAKYGNVNAVWSSNDPSAHPGVDFVEANSTSWLRNTVTKITKTTSEDLETEVGILLDSTIHFKNDSETQKVLYVDLITGNGNGSLMLIPALVYKGELIYPISVGDLLYVNETDSQVSLGVERETNHLDMSTSYTSSGSEISVSIDYHWDVVTGIMTQHRETFSNRTGDYVTLMSISDEIIETNLVWNQPSEPPEDEHIVPPGSSVGSDNTWMWVLGLSIPAGVTGVAFVLYRRRTASRVRYRGRPKSR